MADLRIGQKDEISLGRPAWFHLTRKRDLRLALLPDCGACPERATVAGK